MLQQRPLTAAGQEAKTRKALLDRFGLCAPVPPPWHDWRPLAPWVAAGQGLSRNGVLLEPWQCALCRKVVKNSTQLRTAMAFALEVAKAVQNTPSDTECFEEQLEGGIGNISGNHDMESSGVSPSAIVDEADEYDDLIQYILLEDPNDFSYFECGRNSGGKLWEVEGFTDRVRLLHAWVLSSVHHVQHAKKKKRRPGKRERATARQVGQ